MYIDSERGKMNHWLSIRPESIPFKTKEFLPLHSQFIDLFNPDLDIQYLYIDNKSPVDYVSYFRKFFDCSFNEIVLESDFSVSFTHKYNFVSFTKNYGHSLHNGYGDFAARYAMFKFANKLKIPCAIIASDFICLGFKNWLSILNLRAEKENSILVPDEPTDNKFPSDAACILPQSIIYHLELTYSACCNLKRYDSHRFLRNCAGKNLSFIPEMLMANESEFTFKKYLKNKSIINFNRDELISLLSKVVLFYTDFSCGFSFNHWNFLLEFAQDFKGYLEFLKVEEECRALCLK